MTKAHAKWDTGHSSEKGDTHAHSAVLDEVSSAVFLPHWWTNILEDWDTRTVSAVVEAHESPTGLDPLSSAVVALPPVQDWIASFAAPHRLPLPW